MNHITGFSRHANGFRQTFEPGWQKLPEPHCNAGKQPRYTLDSKPALAAP